MTAPSWRDRPKAIAASRIVASDQIRPCSREPRHAATTVASSAAAASPPATITDHVGAASPIASWIALMLSTTSQPSPSPTQAPITPITSPHCRKIQRMPERDAPTARRMPMSRVFSWTIAQKIDSTSAALTT